MRGPSLHREEHGVALVTALGVAAVISLLATALLTFAVSSEKQGRMHQDWHVALAAAESGVDDYLARLNWGGDYYRYSSTNLPPAGTNEAFATWVPVSNTGGSFTYDARFDPASGTAMLAVSGRKGASTRHLRVTFRNRSPLDYTYLSNYETTDPAAYTTWTKDDGTTVTGAAAVAEADLHCRHYRYEAWTKGGEPRTGRDDRCRDIYWISESGRQDVNKGKFHTNDTIAISGSPIWEGQATTSWDLAAGKRWYDRTGSSSPEFRDTADPTNPDYAPPLDLPQSNRNLKTVAESGGCLYTGPTAIVFNADGTMSVDSPLTVNPNPGCVGTGVARPANGVLYVQDVPAGATAPDPGHPLAQCLQSGTHPLGYPVAGDAVRRGDPNAYSCRYGDAFVEGRYEGASTVGATNNVIITGPLVADRGTGLDSPDMLGLTANNYVEIYHPVSCPTSGSCTNMRPDLADIRIDAAILALQHSFRVQSHRLGETLGEVRVTGSIAQQFRGAVGIFGGNPHGYVKSYDYDYRLAFSSPPYLVDRGTTVWNMVSWTECDGPCGL